MPEETKLKPCPNVCCDGVPRMRQNGPRNAFVVICPNCGWSASKLVASKAEAAELWNTRPESELERLAREVDSAWAEEIQGILRLAMPLSNPALVRALDALAAHFAEQDKERKSE